MSYAFVTSGDQNGSGIDISLAGVVLATNETVIVIATYGDGTPVTETFTDGTNTYTKVGTTITDAADSQSMVGFVCLNAVGGTYTLNLNLSVSETYVAYRYFRYTGLNNLGTAQATSVWRTSPATSTDGLIGTALSPASQPGMLFAFCAETSGNASVPTAGSLFATRGAGTNWTAGIGYNLAEDRQITSTSSVSATFTVSSSTCQYLMYSIFIPEAGGGGGGSVGFNHDSVVCWIGED